MKMILKDRTYLCLSLLVLFSLIVISAGQNFWKISQPNQNEKPKENRNKIIWCTISRAEQQKCLNFAMANERDKIKVGYETLKIECMQAVNKDECMALLDQEKATLTTLDAGAIFIGGRYHSLVPIAQEVLEGGFKFYYAVAVVKKATLTDVISLRDLRGKRACFAGVETFAGWVLPINTLMKIGGMDIIDCNNHVKTASNYFGSSCAVNCLSDKYNPIGDNSDRLCQLCIGKIPGGRCTDNDPYAGYEGAFRCLLETGDIAFLKHNTVAESIGSMDYAGISTESFELLCKDGSRKPIKDHLSCNWGKVPSDAIVTSSAVSFDDRIKLQKFLEKASQLYYKRNVTYDPNKPEFDQYGNRVNQEFDSGGNRNQPEFDQFGNRVQNNEFDQFGNRNNQPEFDRFGNRVNRFKRQSFGDFGTNPNDRNRDNDNPYTNNNPDQDNPYTRDKNNDNPYINNDRDQNNQDNPYIQNSDLDRDRNNQDNPYGRDRNNQDNPYVRDRNNQDRNNDNPYRQNDNDYDPYGNRGTYIDPYGTDDKNKKKDDPFARDPYTINREQYGENIDPYNSDPKYSKDIDPSYFNSTFDHNQNQTNHTFYEVFSLFESIPRYGQHGNLLFQDAARKIVPIPENLQTYTAFLSDALEIIMGVRDCPVNRMTLCVTSDAEKNKCVKMRTALKAQLLKPEMDCYKGHSQIHCMQAVRSGTADITVLDASDVYTAGLNFDLVPFISEMYNLDEPEYYVVAVAKESDPSTELTYLRGKNTCHGGINTAAGWVYPLAFLISNGWIRPYGCNSIRAAAEYFTKSCIPGALSTEYNTGVPYDNMCDLCHGPTYKYCRRDHSEDYYGHTGAFRCLVEGGGHVAFVKHTTVTESTGGKKREWWARDNLNDDFELLCPDGTRAEINEYQRCNLGKVKANAIVTRGGYGYNETQINAYVNLFMYAQTFYGRKFADEFSFSMFTSTPPYSDLIFQDATTQLKVIDPSKRYYSSYLGKDFMRARRIVDCHAGSSTVSISLATLTLSTIFAIVVLGH